MKKRILWTLLAMFSLPLLADPTVEGLYFDQALQGSYNPLGLQAVTKFFYRLPVVKSQGALWESTKLDIGMQNNLSPGYDLFGVFVNVEPIAIFSLKLLAQAGGYYKLFGYGFYDMADYSSGFGPNDLGANQKNAFGYNLSVAPTLKFALGPIAAVNTLSLNYFYADDGQGYFYERTSSAVLKKSDYELVNEAYLMATIFEGFRAGLNDGILFVPNSKYFSHRLSAGAAYTHKLTDHLDIYSALFAGTFLSDRLYQYAFYVGGQVGITLRL